jgi:hypothetical protein
MDATTLAVLTYFLAQSPFISVAEAGAAILLAKRKGLPVVITGSFYVAGGFAGAESL